MPLIDTRVPLIAVSCLAPSWSAMSTPATADTHRTDRRRVVQIDGSRASPHSDPGLGGNHESLCPAAPELPRSRWRIRGSRQNVSTDRRDRNAGPREARASARTARRARRPCPRSGIASRTKQLPRTSTPSALCQQTAANADELDGLERTVTCVLDASDANHCPLNVAARVRIPLWLPPSWSARTSTRQRRPDLRTLVHADVAAAPVGERLAVPTGPAVGEAQPSLVGQCIQLGRCHDPHAPGAEPDAGVGDLDVLAFERVGRRPPAVRTQDETVYGQRGH